MIRFEECRTKGYPARTLQNVLDSDATIAIASDFNSAGERLTKRYCKEYKKLYIPVEYNDYVDILSVVQQLNLEFAFVKNVITLNIAGNGIYSLPDCQQIVNEEVFSILQKILNHPDIMPTVDLIRSGGQTGVDQAGVLAAKDLGIEALVLAPNGWLFRDKDGNDIADEAKFKQRFI